jgi:hypothetical protein
MRIRVAKIPKRCCQGERARCPYLHEDTSWSIVHCEHPTIIRRHGDTVDLKQSAPKTGYLLRLPDCPITGRILTEEGR